VRPGGTIFLNNEAIADRRAIAPIAPIEPIERGEHRHDRRQLAFR
jgi:hypothetical protein